MSAKFKVGDKIRHKQDGYRGVITRVITMNYPCDAYAYEYTIPDRNISGVVISFEVGADIEVNAQGKLVGADE